MNETIWQDLEKLTRLALVEDLDERGDITSDAIFSENDQAGAVIVAKQTGVFCGERVPEIVLQQVDPLVTQLQFAHDGDPVNEGMVLVEMKGAVRSLMAAERTMLNFMGRFSGIATRAAHLASLAQGSDLTLLDTRKTLPGYRRLDKYAVRMGGMQNHRSGLFDQYLIKDNHVDAVGGVTAALQRVRQHQSDNGLNQALIEIEVRSLEEYRVALSQRPDIIMLDHFTPDMIRDAVAIDHNGVRLEYSGNVTPDQIGPLADTGVDRVSLGEVTHSVRAFDLSMRIL